jgi:hypothetical protein
MLNDRIVNASGAGVCALCAAKGSAQASVARTATIARRIVVSLIGCRIEPHQGRTS